MLTPPDATMAEAYPPNANVTKEIIELENIVISRISG